MKRRASKLDPFAERLDTWLSPRDKGGDGLTYAAACALLAQEGCTTNPAALCRWWQRNEQDKLEAVVLGNIRSGARFNDEIAQQFERNPAPDAAAVVKLLRHITMRLAVKGETDPRFLDLTATLVARMLDWEKLQRTDAALKLDLEKFHFDAAKAALAKLPELNALQRNTALDQDARIMQARLALFGEAPV